MSFSLQESQQVVTAAVTVVHCSTRLWNVFRCCKYYKRTEFSWDWRNACPSLRYPTFSSWLAKFKSCIGKCTLKSSRL